MPYADNIDAGRPSTWTCDVCEVHTAAMAGRGYLPPNWVMVRVGGRDASKDSLYCGTGCYTTDTMAKLLKEVR